MYIAYSALHTAGNKTNRRRRSHFNRYKGYKTACSKYRHEIEVIQKYMPGWMPPF